MSARNRERRVRNRTQGKPAKIRWSDVHALLDIELTEADHILDQYLYDPAEEDGAPESVYEDSSLLRAWLQVHHPLAICDGPTCMKCHLHPDYPCNGTHVLAEAQNRTLGEVITRMRAADPKAPTTSARVMEFLQEPGRQEPQHISDKRS